MNWLNKLINKIGTDKCLHFAIGALITAYASMLGVEFMWGALILSPIICAAKEVLDSKFDLKDILAGIIGAIFSVGIYWLMQLALMV